MRKCYQRDFGGQDADKWAASWKSIDLPSSLRFARETSYVTPELKKYVQGRRTLEGGCGPAFYVKAYADRASVIVGADFSVETLLAAKREWPELTLLGADIEQFPFANGAFQVYYSGGVVEHFERGPAKALLEARRVLERDGILIISVPHLNCVRRTADWIRKLICVRHFFLGSEILALNVNDFEASKPIDGWRFHEYAFTPSELRRELENAGLEVISLRGCSILVGLTGLLPHRGKKNSMRAERERSGVAVPAPPGGPRWKRIARRLLLSEEGANALERGLIRVAGALVGHMIVAVARRT